MPEVRSKGQDIVARYQGRRLRIGPDWCDVSADAMESVRVAGGENLEERKPGSGDVVPAAANGGPGKAGEKSNDGKSDDGKSDDGKSSAKKGGGKGSKG